MARHADRLRISLSQSFPAVSIGPADVRQLDSISRSPIQSVYSEAGRTGIRCSLDPEDLDSFLDVERPSKKQRIHHII